MTDVVHPDPQVHKAVERRGCWKKSFGISLLLFGITVAVFHSACDNGFVNLDDNSYVCNQREVMSGLTWHGLNWASTTVVVGNWHPLTMLSLQLDAQLFGPEPSGFHRTSVVIHALNAVLLYLALLSLTGRQFRSLFVAAFFALHPLRVESVAWVSERKDVLSGFFFCLTLLTYAYYVRSPSFARYLLVASCLTLGLSAKAMLVTTPCVLLLLDDWPLRRLDDLSEEVSVRWLSLIAEKVPLFALSAIFSLITLACQEPGINSLADVSLTGRVANATVGYAAYLYQTVCPTELRPFYPLPDVSRLDCYGEAALLITLTVLACWFRKRCPYLLVGWLWFLGMLVPVSGLMQTGGQARADRYTYLPQIGLFLAIVWLVADLTSRSRRAIWISSLIAVGCLIGCAGLTVRQIEVWRNTESLFRRVYQYSPRNTMVIQCLINSLIQTGKKAEALSFTEDAVRNADESDQEQMVMLAMMLAVQHHHDRCEQVLSRSLEHHPETAELYSNRGKARAALGRWDSAAADFRQALKLSPRAVQFQFYLAHALGKAGDHEESRQLYDEALERSPTWFRTAAVDAWRMSTSADPRERANFWPECLAEQAVEASGDPATRMFYLDVLAAAYAHDGKFEQAVTTAEQALEYARAAKQSDLSAAIEDRLKLYERREPYRQRLAGVAPTP